MGEFILAKSLNDSLEIQVRTKPWRGSRFLSVNNAVALNVEGDRVGYYVGREPALYINGVPTAIENINSPLAHGGQISVQSEGITVTWPGSSQVRISSGSHINLKILAARTRQGRMTGILGDFDGQSGNDLVSRSGVSFGFHPSFNELYRQYGDSWRISDAESLFDYLDANTTGTHTDLTFPGAFYTTANLAPDVQEQAEQICRAVGMTDPVLLENCILDVEFTGDPSFAEFITSVEPPVASIEPLIEDLFVSAGWTAANTIVGTSTRQYNFTTESSEAGILEFDVSIDAINGTFNNTLSLQIIHNGNVVKTLATSTENRFNASFLAQTLTLDLGDTWGTRVTAGNFSLSTGTSADIDITITPVIPLFSLSEVLSEDFEDDILDSRISINTNGSFATNPGIQHNTNFGSSEAFGFGLSTCGVSCFDNYLTSFLITLEKPTYISYIKFKEMELHGNWGSKGQIIIGGDLLKQADGNSFGRVPSNDRQADTIFRDQVFYVEKTVTTIELRVRDITNSSEIFIDDLVLIGETE